MVRTTSQFGLSDWPKLGVTLRWSEMRIAACSMLRGCPQTNTLMSGQMFFAYHCLRRLIFSVFSSALGLPTLANPNLAVQFESGGCCFQITASAEQPQTDHHKIKPTCQERRSTRKPDQTLSKTTTNHANERCAYTCVFAKWHGAQHPKLAID